MAEVATCHRCRIEPGPDASARLWDGRAYCRACVDRAAPTLWEFAKAHPDLEDTPATDPEAVRRRFRIVFAALGLFVTLVATGLIVALRGDLVPSVVILVIAINTWGMSLLGYSSLVKTLLGVLPTTRVRAGVVEVHRPLTPRGPAELSLTYPLAEARWRAGSLTDDSFVRSLMIPRSDAIVLLAPRRRIGLLGGHPSRATATGSSPEMRAIWAGFLELAGCKRVGPPPRPSTAIRPTLAEDPSP